MQFASIRFFAPFLFWISAATFVFAQSGVEETQPDRPTAARQWDVVDLRFQADSLTSQPVDTPFAAKFTASDGDTLQVPGFFNGAHEYVIRFTPPSAGNWRYITQSPQPSLDGLQGQLAVAKAVANRKGGITLDARNPRNFTYANGNNYFPIAFEADWIFALDAENPDDIPKTKKFVDTLADNGFNQVVLNVFAYDVKWKKDKALPAKHDYGSPSVFPFAGDNSQPDHSQLNIEYFQRLDRVVDYLDQNGIVAHLMIYVWNKQVNWPAANSAEDNRYFDYTVRRYQAYPNLIWDISKEALGYGHDDDHYISSRIDRLRKLDAYQRLVTVHDYSYCRRFSEKVDFISVQIWASELYSVMRKIFTDFKDKPILNIEHGGYEKGPYVVFTGSYTSPEVCLERAYQCVFAGTYPTHYWQGAAWNVMLPDIDAMASGDRPRLEYYRFMRKLDEQYHLANLTAGDKKSSSGFCLHNDKDLFVYYVPNENINIGVRLPQNLKGGRMTGTWFDPLKGTFADPIGQDITQWPSFDKPFDDQFAILVVKIDTDPAKNRSN
ncbi:DUF5060 domain-containing protein [Planctomycetes bacterium K23_9]|uniref:Endoglucanase n=1 Tax=Stieleria marina TaxID=1930275 RepID=A0A517NSA4_9BACT|nr:Putative endoglucanase [Planctomycetes bacterium K23_9]